jgi:hypothetical protein
VALGDKARPRSRHSLCGAKRANTAHDMASASYELEVRMDPRWTQSNGKSSDSGLAGKFQNIAEVLANLTYLTLKDADRPERVRMYMGLADEQITLLSMYCQTNRVPFLYASPASN